MPKAIVGTLESYSKPCTVTLTGDLDLSTRQNTRSQLQPLALCRYAVVDLRNAYIGDATFFGDLAAAHKAQARRGTIVLVISNERLRRLFCSVHFDKIFPVVATIAEAHRVIALQQAAAE